MSKPSMITRISTRWPANNPGLLIGCGAALVLALFWLLFSTIWAPTHWDDSKPITFAGIASSGVYSTVEVLPSGQANVTKAPATYYLSGKQCTESWYAPLGKCAYKSWIISEAEYNGIKDSWVGSLSDLYGNYVYGTPQPRSGL